MRIEQLEYLLEINKSTSLNSASQKLHISHQCLNKAIKSLEQELNTKLLDRSIKGVTLTDHGQKAVEVAKNVLENINALKTQINIDNNPISAMKGSLSIISTPALTNSVIPDIVEQYRVQYPQVNISITENYPSEVAKLLKEGNYDVGFISINDSDQSFDCRELNYNILFMEKYYVLCNKSCALSNCKTLTFSQTLNHPLIIYCDTLGGLLFYLERMGKEINYISTNNFNIFLNNIINGSCISIIVKSIYSTFNDSYKEKLTIIPLKAKAKICHYMLTLDSKPASKQAKEFIKLINKTYEVDCI